MHWSELRDNEIDMQAKLERFILCRNRTHANSTIKYYIEIDLRTAKKMVKQLGI